MRIKDISGMNKYLYECFTWKSHAKQLSPLDFFHWSLYFQALNKPNNSSNLHSDILYLPQASG